MKKGKINMWWTALKERMTALKERMKALRARQTAEYGDVEAESKRITMQSVTNNFLEIWGFGNRNIFVTLGHLIWRPGFMMRDYLEGRRSRIMQPLMMLVVLTLGLMLLVKILPVEVVPREDVSLQFTNARAHVDESEPDAGDALRILNAAEKVAMYIEELRQWEDEHPDFGLLIKFSWSMLLIWLLFRKSKDKTYNFAEILTVFCYGLCQLQALSIVWLLCTAWWHPQILFHPFIFPYWIVHIVFFIDFQQLFGRRWWSTLWRTFVALLF